MPRANPDPPPRPSRRPWTLGGALLGVAFACIGCATIPQGRYGVDALHLEGVESVDPRALQACLATRPRPSVSLELSVDPEPTCNLPPFDAERIHVPLWRWGFTDWPLYDPVIFERDLHRIERWYRARGFYDVKLLPPEADPPEALHNTPSGQDRVRLTVHVEEGEPVHVSQTALRGLAGLPRSLKKQLRRALQLAQGDRFDEALYDATKVDLLRILQDAGYADARVGGRVVIEPAAHTANVRWTIAPGALSEFGEVCVEGFGQLPAEMILRASGLEPGGPFSTLDVEDARTRIYQLRVFAEVEVARSQDLSEAEDERAAAPLNPSRSEDGEWLAWQSTEAPEPGSRGPRVCRRPETDSPNPRISITIRVKPARLYRLGLGGGLQVGVEDGQRAIAATQQWDVHLTSFVELYNFLGGLRKLRIEDRPKLVIPAAFPQVHSDTDTKLAVGNTLTVRLESPAFLEDRTTLEAFGSWDHGPDPFGGDFIRDDVRLRIGPRREFFHNRLTVAASIDFNPYFPHAEGNPEVAAERYNLLFLRQDISWDGRDNRQRPHRGVHALLELHETLPPSDWTYVRLTPELRGYVPLPYGIVIATRAGVGAIWMRKTSADTEQLRRLGPRPYRFFGGGAYSVRGVHSGLLGVRPDQLAPGPGGEPPSGFPGGTRSWISSLELRVPLSQNVAFAVFGDAGDVDGGSAVQAARFRFNHPHTTLGAGLRYHTLVGPVRLDVGWLVPGLQGQDEVPRDEQQGRPLIRFNGAINLTIGEAF